MKKDIISIHSKLQDLTDEIKNQLNDENKHYLEYFWNSRRKEIRKALPQEIIVFWENEPLNEKNHLLKKSDVILKLLDLVGKGYITQKGHGNSVNYELTIKGFSFLKDLHPKWSITIDRILERIPNLLKVIIILIGLIGSLLTIFQVLKVI